eukprot:1563379-Amphidinium_carterae.1
MVTADSDLSTERVKLAGPHFHMLMRVAVTQYERLAADPDSGAWFNKITDKGKVALSLTPILSAATFGFSMRAGDSEYAVVRDEEAMKDLPTIFTGIGVAGFRDAVSIA